MEKSNSISNEDMPKYMQYPGACGLTSLLMALKPISRSFVPILDDLWGKVSERYKLISNLEKSKNWQIVMEWLLFQTAENESLQNKLAENFGDIFYESMLPILRYGIEGANPFSVRNTFNSDEVKYNINREWLMKRVYVWKQNIELSILMNIFGFEFHPWKLNQDGTGAIYFTSKELKKKNKLYNQKLNFLLERIKLEDPILCCESIHWIAIKDFQKKRNDYIVIYHDPATASENLRFLKYFRESDRFYVYQLNSQLYESFQEILNSL